MRDEELVGDDMIYADRRKNRHTFADGLVLGAAIVAIVVALAVLACTHSLPFLN